MSLLTSLGMSSMAFCAWFTWINVTATGKKGVDKRAAVIESWAHILIGFAINFIANIFVIPLMTGGHGTTVTTNWWGGWVFTSISMLRTFCIRQFLGERIHEFAKRFR